MHPTRGTTTKLTTRLRHQSSAVHSAAHIRARLARPEKPSQLKCLRSISSTKASALPAAVRSILSRANVARAASAETPEVGESRADLVGEGLPDQDGVLGNPVEAEPHHGQPQHLGVRRGDVGPRDADGWIARPEQGHGPEAD